MENGQSALALVESRIYFNGAKGYGIIGGANVTLWQIDKSDTYGCGCRRPCCCQHSFAIIIISFHSSYTRPCPVRVVADVPGKRNSVVKS